MSIAIDPGKLRCALAAADFAIITSKGAGRPDEPLATIGRNHLWTLREICRDTLDSIERIEEKAKT